MAEAAKDTSGAAGNTAVPAHGDHDRVAMLSLNPDGTPAQRDPEIIGDREFARDATREQFKQQAVSAVDQQLRGVATGPDGGEEPAVQDPAIAELQDAHDKAAGEAEKAADSTVGALFTDDPQLATDTAPSTATGKDTPAKRSS